MDLTDGGDEVVNLEELQQLQQRNEQKAQFTHYLCIFCFLLHIVLVSALLLKFINMKESDNPDNYLIFKNMLFAFICSLGGLLCWVVCIPAGKLALGGRIQAWQRRYFEEGATRARGGQQHKSEPEQGSSSGNQRQPAWGSSNQATSYPSQQTVNAAMFGASYRLKNANSFAQTLPQLYQAQGALQDAAGGHGHGHGHGHALEDGRPTPSAMERGFAHHRQQQEESPPPGVILARDGTIERYDPDAYRAAALRAMEARVPASFSPMQVRDLAMRPEDPPMPGLMAIQDAMPRRDLAATTGSSFYRS